jgi:hypothetical protein
VWGDTITLREDRESEYQARHYSEACPTKLILNKVGKTVFGRSSFNVSDEDARRGGIIAVRCIPRLRMQPPDLEIVLIFRWQLLIATVPKCLTSVELTTITGTAVKLTESNQSS